MHEPACGEMLRDVFFRYPCNANPGQSSLDHQVDVAKRHRAIDVDTRALAPVRQIPSVQRAALEAKANATVTGKIVRRLRGPATGQAGRRGHCRETHVRSKADRDHVARDILKHTYARIEPTLDDIDESGVNDELDMNVRIPGEKIRQDVAQYPMQL